MIELVAREVKASGPILSIVLERDGLAEHAARAMGGKPCRVRLLKRGRTTGPMSQNHRLNGFIGQFCDETGNDFADIKLFVKRRAMRRGLGPMLNSRGEIVYSKIDGEPLPKSESDMDVEECSWVIEEIQQLGAEEGIIFIEVSE